MTVRWICAVPSEDIEDLDVAIPFLDKATVLGTLGPQELSAPSQERIGARAACIGRAST